MKKFLSILAVSVMAIACTQKKAPKILVLYYSQGGNTKAVAGQISSLLGADIEEVIAAEPYDGDFQETIARCLKEREQGVLPGIQPVSSDLKAYDFIFLGYPVWFGTYAPPIASLLDSVDLTGMKVVPFCTFGSGGLESSMEDLKAKQPEAEVLPGYGVRAARMDAMPAEVDRFLKESGFIEGEYEKYEPFGPTSPVTEEESAVFNAAVDGYPMLNAEAVNVSSRAVSGGTEYLFEARDIPRMPSPDSSVHIIKVYVLSLEGQSPVFTRVVR